MNEQNLSSEDIDLEDFQEQVLYVLQGMQVLGYPDEPVFDERVRMANLADEAAHGAFPSPFWWIKRSSKAETPEEIAQRIKKIAENADNLAKKPNLRALLCPSLTTIINDVYEVSKVITPVLVGASITGTISIPLNPLLFAILAMLIARISISNFCPEEKKTK